MAFTIEFFQNTSEAIAINKQLTTIATMSGTLRSSSSIIDPVIIINASLDDVNNVPGFAKSNYARIPAFNRSYFIRDIVSLTNTTLAIYMHVDVLSSFADEIKANTGIVFRAESSAQFNLYLNDGSLKAYQNPYVMTEPFPHGFTGSAFCLAVAGG